MSRRADDDLQRYFDGELSARSARRVHARIEQSADDRRRLEALGQMRDLLGAASATAAEEADFSGLWDGVARGIASARPPAPADRLLAWFRRHALVGASAVAAAAAAAIVLVFSLTAAPPRNDCVIESLEVGQGAVSTIFTIDDPDATGETTVIWVSETAAEGEM